MEIFWRSLIYLYIRSWHGRLTKKTVELCCLLHSSTSSEIHSVVLFFHSVLRICKSISISLGIQVFPFSSASSKFLWWHFYVPSRACHWIFFQKWDVRCVRQTCQVSPHMVGTDTCINHSEVSVGYVAEVVFCSRLNNLIRS